MILFLTFLLPSSVFSTIVTTSYGKLDGDQSIAPNGATVHLFRGIPQTKPPVGNLRFKLPEKVEKWNGTLNAKEYKAACPSNSTESHSVPKIVNEDCLYINIFTSDNCLKGNISCPVIIYLHGGGLNYDSAVQFNDTFLVDKYVQKDIVFVIPAMRVGTLGLLHFEDPLLVPRNIPVYDVMKGIEFVNEEIHNFGGNNSRVTLMGHSMGASLVLSLGYMRNYDVERKLFQQLLPMSGLFNYVTDETRLQATKKILGILGCQLPNDVDSLACVSKLDYMTILRAQRKAEEDGGFKHDGLSFAAPVADMNEDFHERMNKAQKRNMLVGTTEREFDWDIQTDRFEVGRFVGLKNRDGILKKFKEDAANKDHRASKFASYQSQEVFVSALYYGIIMEKKGANVWLYEYTQDVASHSSDMMFFNGNHPKEMTPDREVLQQVYNDMIVNYVRGEKPLSEYLPLNGTTANYLKIESNISKGIAPKMKQGYHLPEFNYWTDEMTSYDNTLSGHSAATWALPMVIGIVLFVVIVVAAIAFFLKNKPVAEETRPLLS